jgi:hypothetical protein
LHVIAQSFPRCSFILMLSLYATGGLVRSVWSRLGVTCPVPCSLHLSEYDLHDLLAILLLSLTGKKESSGLVELDVLHEQLSPGVRVQSIPGAALKILTPHAAKNVRRQNGILLKNDFVGNLLDARHEFCKEIIL